MSPTVELSSPTFKRLQSHAVPLVDTIETVIARLLDNYESKASGTSDEAIGGVRKFNPESPPDLTHSRILGVTYNGRKLGRGEDNWNGLLSNAVIDAWKSKKSADEFKRMMAVNYVAEKKTDEGYRPLQGTPISIQGQDANGAWRGVLSIALSLGRPVSVRFAWREKDGAAFPGTTGQLDINS